jgi:alkylation response protein AidB-like acyl-CoA dehydrogenase
VSFRVADGAMKLDAARALVHAAARTVDAEGATGRSRRLVSEAKRFATEACWEIVNHAMQILGASVTRVSTRSSASSAMPG